MRTTESAPPRANAEDGERGFPGGPGLMRRVAAWSLSATVALVPFAFVTDATLLAHADAPRSAALAAAAVSASLCGIAAVVFALPAAILEAAVARLAAVRRPWCRLWPVPLLGITVWVAATLTHAASRQQPWANVLVMSCFTLAVATVVLVARTARPVLSTAGLVGWTALVLVLAGTVTAGQQDRSDLSTVLAVCSAVAAASPLRRRLERARALVLSLALPTVVVVSLLTILHVDSGVPGWRTWSVQYARFQPALGRLFRALVDFDGDGYSPIAWGGDCDDFDRNRHPFGNPHGHLLESCTPILTPLPPRDEVCGLAPPAGEPGAKGEIDTVVLVTIDCWRADAFLPEVTPRLTALAARGVTLDRMYATGAFTRRSVLNLHHVNRRDVSIATIMGLAGISSTGIFSFSQPIFRPFLDGFGEAHVAADARWDAAQVTDIALADLRAHAGQHYLWLHYADAHAPLEWAPGIPEMRGPSSMPASYGKYLTQLARVDRELGRMLDLLEVSGRMQRTLIVVTGDHGEGFGSHGVDTHGTTAYEALIHVPGIVVAPGLAPAHVAALTSHRDIPPTLLGAMGLLDAHSEAFGRSLLRLRAAPRAPLHKFVVSYSARARAGDDPVQPLAAIRELDAKLIETLDNGIIELYNPAVDPGELHDYAARDPVTVDRLRAELEAFYDVDMHPY